MEKKETNKKKEKNYVLYDLSIMLNLKDSLMHY